MSKSLFLGLGFWWSVVVLWGQSTEGLQWILPLQSNLIPTGKSSSEYVALKGEKVMLMDIHQQMTSLPYDSVSHDHHAFWKVWQNGLQGVYHQTKGELLPPVFEKVTAALNAENNWAFNVFKYGMNAVVTDQNQLLLPYQKYSYGRFTSVNDTILGYSKMGNGNATIDQLSYISYHGKEITLPIARPFFPPDFQRISANAFVLTQYQKGVPKSDTFPEAGKFINDIAVVRKDSLWGYLKRDGKWMIPPRFQSATSFEKGRYAIVKSKEKSGAINLKGEFVVQPQYDVLKVSVPGYFEYKVEGNIGLLDSLGQVVIKPGSYSRFASAGSQSIAAKSGDSLLIFRSDGSLVTADRVVEHKSMLTDNFLCKIETGSKEKRNRKSVWGLISPDGKWKIDPVMNGSVIERKNFMLAETKSDPCCQIGGLQYEKSASNQYFVFDWDGKPYLNYPVVASYTLPDDRFLIFNRANQFGLITYLHQLIDPVYDEIQAMGNGWVKVRQGEKWGMLYWPEK